MNFEPVDTDERNIESYSTTEQVIGTWIDSKPIYRKVITGLSITISASAPTWNNIVAEANVDTLVDIVPYTNTGGIWYGVLIFDYYNGYFRAYPVSSLNTIVAALCVEYTKTTD